MKKIMFNDKYGMTDAVLNGRKTMTRRLIPILLSFDPRLDWIDLGADDNGKVNIAVFHVETYKYSLYPQYQPGEVVAVAQSYKSIHEEMMNGDYGNSRYDAFRCAMVAGTKGWDNKMFVRADLMPHRIRITDIKVERLQDISDDDCLKEGIYVSDTFTKYGIRNGYSPQCTKDPKEKKWWFGSPREAFASLIERPGIVHKGDWGKNPWVFAYSFELVNL